MKRGSRFMFWGFMLCVIGMTWQHDSLSAIKIIGLILAVVGFLMFSFGAVSLDIALQKIEEKLKKLEEKAGLREETHES